MQRHCQAALHGNHMVLVHCKACAFHLLHEGSCGLPAPDYFLRQVDLLPKRVQLQGGVSLCRTACTGRARRVALDCMGVLSSPSHRVEPLLQMQCGVALGGVCTRYEPRGAGGAWLHAPAIEGLQLGTTAGAAAAAASEPGSSGWHARAAPSRCMPCSAEQAGSGSGVWAGWPAAAGVGWAAARAMQSSSRMVGWLIAPEARTH